MIKRLEKRLLLIRRSDNSDLRAKQVFLLKDGLAMVDKIDQPVKELNQLLKPCLDDRDHLDVKRFFNILTQKMEKNSKIKTAVYQSFSLLVKISLDKGISCLTYFSVPSLTALP